jgi:FtsH-binding integral membrane protein
LFNHSVFAKISNKFPTNFIVLGVFTLAESYLVTYVTMSYTADSVMLSGVATLASTLGLTYYAMTTK